MSLFVRELAKRKQTFLTKFTHSPKKMDFLSKFIMNQDHKTTHNEEFYSNCNAYFEFLRKKGQTDYNFEDEYYFTMPAISSH